MNHGKQHKTPNIYRKLAKAKNMPKKTKTPTPSPARVSDESENMNDKSSPSGVAGDDVLPSTNLVAAVEALGDVSGSVSSTGAVSGEPAQATAFVRLSEVKHGEWKLVAEGEGLSLSEFVRRCVDPVVDARLRCSHPSGSRQVYPWSESCLLCGVRLRG